MKALGRSLLWLLGLAFRLAVLALTGKWLTFERPELPAGTKERKPRPAGRGTPRQGPVRRPPSPPPSGGRWAPPPPPEGAVVGGAQGQRFTTPPPWEARGLRAQLRDRESLRAALVLGEALRPYRGPGRGRAPRAR